MVNSRNNTTNLSNNSSALFEPSIVRSVREGSSGITIYETQDGTITNDSSLGVSSSFKYDAQGNGIKNTQQLKVDWSDFANHTFFNSAQVKTNVAFQKVLNEFPFDGTKQKVELFLDGLTGFERYVYNEFPKNKDYLIFSGTQPGETFGGTYVLTQDAAGAAYPDASVKVTGQSFLDPGYSSMTLEYYCYLSESANNTEIIADKHVDANGFCVGISSSVDTTQAQMSFYAMSGSVSDSLSLTVSKGEWNHVAWVWDRNASVNKIFGYVNSVLVASSSNQVEMDYVSTNGTNLLIGSGSSISPFGVTPDATFSGYLDEFRLWHDVRTQTEIEQYQQKVIFSDDSKLKLYYRFDEPVDVNSNIVIDYSSNSLHGRLSSGGVTLGVRNIDKSISHPDNPMVYQKLIYSPILFPDSTEVFELQNDFLVDAVAYDKINPNLITRLIPPHYLVEGQENDGLDTEEGEIVSYTEGGQEPRSARLGGTQTLLLMLYTWAKFFDEIKLYTQAFSNLDYVDYNETDTVPDEFLQDMAGRYGLTLPPLFQGSSIEQFVEAENVDNIVSTNALSLQNVQNQIWRRILINMQDFMKSKGTLHSVKSFIRTIGIDPDSTFRIREYGGPNKQPLTYVRETKTEVASMLNFVSGGYIQSPILRSLEERTEPGWPYVGSSTNDYTNIFTSGSFSYEGTYKFNSNISTGTSQSLVSLFASSSTTDEGTTSGRKALLVNVVATKGGNVTLYARNLFFLLSSDIYPPLVLPLTGADIFDGDTWYVSCGRQRSDDPGLGVPTNISSSYFLRLAKSINGEIVETHVTQSYYMESNPNADLDLFQLSQVDPGIQGAYFTIGSSSIDNSIYTGSIYTGLNTVTASIPLDSRYTDFTGKVGQIRFWSKYLTDPEWKEHVRNFKSVGVQKPSANFNFNLTATGSFERLRLDCSTDQLVTQSNSSGEIVLTDFSQNNLQVSGTNFPGNYQVIDPQRFYFSYISPKFDEGSTVNKIRIRGFQDYNKVLESPWAESAPVYDIPKSEEPTDNERFSIDFSVVDALNEDIMTIFSTLDELDNIIGNPELMFSSDYPGLENLREIYFNKLTGQMNIKGFFEFFKWFDTNIGTFVSQLLPRKTKFLGTNFVISSHALERPKVQYNFEDIYLGDSNRDALKDTILLQLLQGEFSRY